MSKNAKTEAAKPETTSMVISSEKPSFLTGKENAPARGMEDVTANDIVIPRLEVVQSLSPARDKTSPAFIAGAEEGTLYNNVTRELYGTEAFVVPVVYKKQWLVWKDRKQGGSGANGFRGAFNTEGDAKAKITELSEETGLEAVETAQHFCYLVRADGRTDEIVLSMSKSKLKVSKRWNSLMRIAGGDSFTHVYKINAVTEANAKGDKFQNLTVSSVGYVPEGIYRKAEALYSQIHKGGVVVSNDYEETSAGQPGDHNEY